MTRKLYVNLLRLHPAQFRRRFALEMLAIFDEASADGSTLPLLADGFLSLIRQRVYPYRPVVVAAAPGDAGIPVFNSLDTSLPKWRYLTTGATLALVLFSALTVSIGRGGGRGPGILIGAFQPRPNVFRVDRDSIEPSWPTTEVRVGPATPAQPSGQLVTGLYPLFSLGVLFFFCDRGGNLRLSGAEMANCPSMLRALDRDKDGSLRPAETYLDLAVLDRDRNGIISSDEISHCTAVLRGFDAKGDGTLSLTEVVAAVLAAKGH